jgi:Phthiocerol/phthiodiolone dimycocerosyl transferase C-terminus
LKRELGTLERALLIADQHAPFHIVSVLHLENAPSPHILKQSLQILQNRHPFLRSRLLHEKGNHYFARLVEPPLPFYFFPRWNAEHWIYIAEVELGKRIDALSGPLFRCTYLYSEADERGDIIFAFFHSIVDASSVSQFLHELLSVCASFMDQKTVSPYELPPTPPAESRFPTAFRGLPLTLNQVRYAFQQMIDEFVYRMQTRGKRIPPLHNHSSQGHILSIQMPEDLTESLAQHARKEGMTLNSVLNAAMLLAVNRHLYAGQEVPMRTFSFASLRPYVQPPLGDEDLACYLSLLRYTVLVSGGVDFWSLARNLHKKIYSSLKSGDKFVAATLAEPLMKMVTSSKSFRMGSTALNYSGVVPVQSVYGSMRVMGLHGFVSVYDLGPEFSAEAQIFSNQLFWDFMYLEADMSREEANAIVEEIKSILKAALQNYLK